MAKAKKQQPARSATFGWLLQAIERAAQSQLVVTGSLPAKNVGLVVDPLGPIKFPLKSATKIALINACHMAPYGQGTKTLIDTSVRNTHELDASQFQVSDEWKTAINGIVRTVAEGLGLPPDRLEAHPYKMLIYERGGLFKPHRDSEKLDRMVASLIVVLPHKFAGGSLIVTHGPHQKVIPFREAATTQAASFAAFYADCEHEVTEVKQGARIALTYNLVLNATSVAVTTIPPSETDQLVRSIGSWFMQNPGKPLLFAFEHLYTQHGLTSDLLKGDDRVLADFVLPAVANAHCLAHFTQVERQITQYADDDYDSRTRRRVRHLGEVYEDAFSGTEWFDMEGKRQPWSKLPLDMKAVISAIPMENWKPTREEYEGYTGNEGNTLDRWYHRSALVVWPRDQHFEVLASMPLTESIPILVSMVNKLAKTAKKNHDTARQECVQLARAIGSHWPRKYSHHGSINSLLDPLTKHFLNQLVALKDPATVDYFLQMIAARDQALTLSAFIVEAGRTMGWTTFAGGLKQLLLQVVNEHRPDELLARNYQWLAAYCCEPTSDGSHRRLAVELCEVAIKRYCVSPPQATSQHLRQPRLQTNTHELILPYLLKALLGCGHEAGMQTVLQFVKQVPQHIDRELAVLPTLIELIPWMKKKRLAIPAALRTWLSDIRGQLEEATAHKPMPPKDWARPVNIQCTCAECKQLIQFLADATQGQGRIVTAEVGRRHLIDMIERTGSDVQHTLDRTTKPIALALYKTIGSYDRALVRYEKDRQLLASLPTL